MRATSSFVAVVALLLTAGSLIVLGGVLFALLLFFPLFVLALLGVFAGLEDRTVHQRDVSTDPTRWRNCS